MIYVATVAVLKGDIVHAGANLGFEGAPLDLRQSSMTSWKMSEKDHGYVR